MLTVSALSPSVTKFCARRTFMFSSTSTLLGYKVDVIFGARTPLEPLALEESRKSLFCTPGCQATL